MSGESRYAEGRRLADQGKLDQAEAAFREADEQGHPAAAAVSGLFDEAAGRRAEAEAAYRRADERGDGLGSLRLGLLLAGADRWDEAKRAFTRAEDRGAEDPPAAVAQMLEATRASGAAEADTGSPARAAVRSGSPLASPVLVGAVAVLILITAVFLSYNANRGLPFVPTRELKLDIPGGSNLVPGNDVREGGFRVGLVSELKPVVLRGGQTGAELTLKLDQAHDRVPVDSTATILSRSVLGLKYVDIHVGMAQRAFADGGRLPLGHTSVPVQFDDVYKTFNAPTRRAIQRDLAGYGDALASRGSSLNDTIAALPSFLGYLRPVAKYLADPSTGLLRFFDSTERFMSAVAPVAGVNARLFGDQAITFAAIDRSPSDLQATIRRSPSTLDVSTVSLRAQLPFLRDFALFGESFSPATASLRHSLPIVTPAVEIGTRTLARTPSLNAGLQRLMVSLRGLALDPGTNIALNALVDTTGTLGPVVRYLGPYVTVCNDWNYWWTYLGEHLSERTNFGFGQRALINSADSTQQDNVGSIPASAPAGSFGGPEYLHDPAYGAAVDSSGNADCETGQRGYVKKLNAVDPLGRTLDTDPRTPGNQGPTWTGIGHVPAGETFSRNPTTGSQLTANPANP